MGAILGGVIYNLLFRTGAEGFLSLRSLGGAIFYLGMFALLAVVLQNRR